MLRFIKHNLTSIDQIEIYPIISLLIFVIFFVVMLTYVIRMKKTDIAEMSALPMDNDTNEEATDPK